MRNLLYVTVFGLISMDLLKISHMHRTHPKFIYANYVFFYYNLQNVIQYFAIFEGVRYSFIHLKIESPCVRLQNK